MNITEANAVNKVLRWILRAQRDDHTEKAQEAAKFLADRASRALHAGLKPADITEHWPTSPPGTLSDGDRQVLTKMATINGDGCPPGCQCRQWARQVADTLRTELPDIADTTLARVLLKTSALITLRALTSNLNGMHAGGLLGGAAVELAHLEIGDPTA